MMSGSTTRCLKRLESRLSQSKFEAFHTFNRPVLGHITTQNPFLPRKFERHRRYNHGETLPRNVKGEANHRSYTFQCYKSSLNFPSATASLKDIAESNIQEGAEIVLHGYCSSRNDLSKKLSFVYFHDVDLCRSIQLVWNLPREPTDSESLVHSIVKSLEPNSPVAIKGVLKRRNVENQSIPHTVKNFEIDLRDIHVLNHFPKDIIVTPDTVFPPKKRHLQLRFGDEIRDALRFRSKVMNICRDVLSGQSVPFVEIDTPLLFKSTPEGAREFIVPTRRKGYAYALPQSPQQYKQLLMASGIPRYYQFAKCFRDEDLRADRQPEFTQLDLEMSFATARDVMDCIETIMKKLWADLLDVQFQDQFPQMTYADAMSRYGSDKPDLRIEMEISRVDYLLPVDLISKITPLVNPIVEMIKFSVSDEPKETREFVSSFLSSPEGKEYLDNPEGGPGIFISDSGRPLQGLQALGFEAAEVIGEDLWNGDLVVLQARQNAPFTRGSTPLGNLRRALHKEAVNKGYCDVPEGFDVRWITDFPLFSPASDAEPGQGGDAGIASTHHPFTAPKTGADVDLLLSNPTHAIGDHYDLVVNGVELGGGSRRIHHAGMQEFVLKDVLKMPQDRLGQFSHLIEALNAGCPPHAGIALGFDRLIAVMLGRESVRDVMAFPKSGRGEDMMVKSPGLVNSSTLDTYHLKLRE